MQLFIDADACPVIDCALQIARSYGIPVVLVCDASHVLQRDGARTVTVAEGVDSADFMLLSLIRPGDVVITQDYGLAAMCLSRRAYVLNQNGMAYTDANIDALLLSRHIAKKIRRSGGRIQGSQKRTRAQDMAFCAALRSLFDAVLTLP